jgi:hypothetical protein
MNNTKSKSSNQAQFIRPSNTITNTSDNLNGKSVRPMYKNVSLTMLNYLAFFILFITSFVFIFQKNAAILGYALVFITTTICMVYIAGELIPKLDPEFDFFVTMLATIAVATSAILHFVSLIFILMMIYKLHVKYTVTNGLPINIPEPYSSQLYDFKVLMITTFCICTLLIAIIKFRPAKLDVNFYELLKRLTMFSFIRNITLFITLGLSISAIVISSLQVKTADGLAKLSRQQLNTTEYKAAKKTNKNLHMSIDGLSGSSQSIKTLLSDIFLFNP